MSGQPSCNWVNIRNTGHPTPIIDIGDTYERILRDVHRYNGTILKHQQAVTVRTQWVQLYHVNQVLVRPPLLFAPATVTDASTPQQVADALNHARILLRRLAHKNACEVHWSDTVVWAGSPTVIQAWIDKLK